MFEGRCECGLVQYKVDGEIRDLSHCHCSQCRRLHGAAYVTFAGIHRNTFRYTAGAANVKIYSSSNTMDRAFCGECGSNILADYKPEADFLYVCMGNVDGNPPRPSGYHQFVGSKAAWHDITDDLERHDRWPPS